MAEDAVKLPFTRLEIPRPKPWDLAAALVLLLAAAGAAANLWLALRLPPGTSISSSLTLLFVLVQLGLATLGLLVLGKTAKAGTLWGNLLAIGALVVGMSGVLLAAALWSAA
jgi:hypothetical protein